MRQACARSSGFADPGERLGDAGDRVDIAGKRCGRLLQVGDGGAHVAGRQGNAGQQERCRNGFGRIAAQCVEDPGSLVPAMLRDVRARLRPQSLFRRHRIGGAGPRLSGKDAVLRHFQDPGCRGLSHGPRVPQARAHRRRRKTIAKSGKALAIGVWRARVDARPGHARYLWHMRASAGGWKLRPVGVVHPCCGETQKNAPEGAMGVSQVRTERDRPRLCIQI